MERVHHNIVSDIPGYGPSAAVVSPKSSDAVVTATIVEVTGSEKALGTLIAWGDNNDTPQKIFKEARANGSVSNSLRINQKAHYGNGVILYEEVTSEGKKSVNVFAATDPKVKVINDFFKLNMMPRFFKETIADLEWYGIAFAEFVLSENYATINRVKRHRAAWCRFEEPDEITGVINHVYISQKFGSGKSVSIESKFVNIVDYIDPYMSPDEVREHCKAKGIKKFIRPVFYPMINEAFYPHHAWHAVFENGWLDVSNSVPNYKTNLFANQMSALFKVTVHEKYFEKIYGEEWHKYTIEERASIRETFDNQIKEALTGNKAAGKMIRSIKIYDGKEWVDAIEITPIDNKSKDGIYLPEAEAANGEIYAAMGVDASMTTGGVPGGKLGAGSGSDKREAFTILQILKKTDREITLENTDFIKAYNNWPEEVNIGFENITLTTLDANPTGTKTTV